MHHSPASPGLALILAAALSATGAVAAPGTDGPTVERTTEVATRPAPSLEGNPWLLAAYRDGEALVERGAGDPPAGFHLKAGHLKGTVGCNQLGGAYTLTGEQLVFKPNLRATMMACPEPLMRQEQAVGVALTRVTAWRLDGDRLEFLDAAGQPLLRFLPLTPPPLVGAVWRLIDYADGKHAIVAPRTGSGVSLEFRDDETLGGVNGCNRYTSGYTLTGGTLTIGPLASTRMACQEPQGAAQQARDYADAMGTVAGYRIAGGELLLLTDTGKTAARFHAETKPAPLAADSAHRDAAPPAPEAPRQALPTPAADTAAPAGTGGAAAAPAPAAPR